MPTVFGRSVSFIVGSAGMLFGKHAFSDRGIHAGFSLPFCLSSPLRRQGSSDFGWFDLDVASRLGIPAGFHSPPGERVTSLCVAKEK
jgi:hypothetical protein